MKSFVKLRSHPKKGYYWRKVICEGCSKACRYRDFRAGIPSFQEIHASLRARHETVGPENCRFRYKRRGTVLGIMHEHKRQMWEEHVEQCMQAQTAPPPASQLACSGETGISKEEEDSPW